MRAVRRVDTMMAAAVGQAVTVVVPCYNEADNVEDAYRAVVAELSDYDLDLLFVDDGSADATLTVIRRIAATDPRLRYLSFTRNFGFEAAFCAGFRYADQPWVLQLDADLQFPAAEARKLLDRALEGYDAVYGVRTNRDDPLVRRVASRIYHFLGSRVLGIQIPTGATTFRVVRTSLARRIAEQQPAARYFMASVPRLTSRYTTVPITHRAREHGRSKFRLRGLASHALDLYFGFSTRLGALAVGTAAVAATALFTTCVLFVAGLLGPSTAIKLSMLADGCAMFALAGLIRYSVMGFGSVQQPAQFCIREANFPVDAGDLLDPADAAPARQRPVTTAASATLGDSR